MYQNLTCCSFYLNETNYQRAVIIKNNNFKVLVYTNRCFSNHRLAIIFIPVTFGGSLPVLPKSATPDSFVGLKRYSIIYYQYSVAENVYFIVIYKH